MSLAYPQASDHKQYYSHESACRIVIIRPGKVWLSSGISCEPCSVYLVFTNISALAERLQSLRDTESLNPIYAYTCYMYLLTVSRAPQVVWVFVYASY
jgi:hypothetical protein